MTGFLAHLNLRALQGPGKMSMSHEKTLGEGDELMAVQSFKAKPQFCLRRWCL